MNNKILFGGVVGFAAAVSLAGCNAPAPSKPAVDIAKLADAVKADAAQLVTDFNAHDAVKAVGHDASGVVWMYHGQPNVVGVDADLADTKTQMADPAAKLVASNETVEVASSGDMAVWHSTYARTFTDPKTKTPITENGNWLMGYKPQPDGSWKITWSTMSDTPTAAPAAPAPKT